MKKVLLLFISIAAISQFSFGQVATAYDFTQTQGIYEEITGGTAIWTGTFNNDDPVEISIPSFIFDGIAYTSIFVSVNGFITFGTAPAGNLHAPLSETGSYAGAIAAFGRNLGNAATGSPEVRWQQIGNVVVVQWKDVRRYLVGGEIISFQIKLNTSDNQIDVVYGGTINPGQNSLYPQVGLRGPDNTFGSNVNNRMIGIDGGNWINSTAGVANNSTMYFRSTSPETVPSVGLTFTWTPGAFTPCYPPLGLTTTNITTNSVTLNWNPPTPPPDDGYQWEIRTSGAAGSGTTGLSASGSTEAGITSTNVTGLTDGTNYNFYVRSTCGVDYFSAWAGPSAFTTLCLPITNLPCNQSFESLNFPPNCWDNIQVTGSGLWSGVTNGTFPTITPQDGSRMAMFESFNYPESTSAILVSPIINYPAIGYNVKFWMYRDNGYETNLDRVVVHFNNTPGLTGSSILGMVHRSTIQAPAVASPGWYQYEFIHNQAVTGDAFIIFQGISDNGHNMYIDNIEIAEQELLSFSLSPSMHNFGQIPIGNTSAPQLFTLANTGLGTMTINAVALTGSHHSNFILDDINTYPLSLNSGESAFVSVGFSPQSEGLKTASLLVSTSLGPYEAVLTGTGFVEIIVELPFVETWISGSFTTNNWSFDPVQGTWQIRTTTGNPAPCARVHYAPMTTNYTFSLLSPLINISGISSLTFSYDLTLNDYSYMGTELMKIWLWSNTDWMLVAEYSNIGHIPWTTFTFTIDNIVAEQTRIRFEATGANTDNINFWEVDNISLEATGLPSFELSPLSHDYGEIMIGNTSAPQSFTLANTGSGVVTVNAVELTGADAFEFILADTNTYPLQLNEGQNAFVNISFAPQYVGLREAFLTITTSIGSFEASLTGTGFELIPEIFINPTFFIQEIVIDSIASQDLTISNIGTGVLIYQIEIEYTNPTGGFSWFSANPATGSIPEAGMQTIEVIFNTAGLIVGMSYEANLIISSNDPATPVVTIPVTLSILLGLDYVYESRPHIYPIPAKDMIQISNIENITRIQMFNSFGQLIYENANKDFPAVSVNLLGFENGFYLIRFTTTDNLYLYHKLIINK